MKVSDLRRKLAAALAAGGMLTPVAARAANLDTNLIVNAGFENVDFGTTGTYGGPVILEWSNNGVAISHDGTGGVPDYANPEGPGNGLVGGGSWYFYPGASVGEELPKETLADAITQTIDVSAGATGTLIAGGAARFNLSAYFSSYLLQTDHGIVQVDFLNSGDTVLGTAQVTPGPQALPDWTQLLTVGNVPVGTAKVKVSAWGVLISGGAADGYMDNLDFKVSASLPFLNVLVNRSTGAITLQNQTGSAKNISGYSITSAFEALTPATWLSITDNYDSGNPGPNQVDPAHAWAETTLPDAHGDLTESDPSTAGASLANNRTVNLGNAWIATPTQDLVFTYTSGGQQVTGIVTYTGGPNGQTIVQGDLNVDGAITSADWVIVRTNQLANLSADSLAEAYRKGDFNGDKQNNHADFRIFKGLYDAANGEGAFVAMVAGVPEPSSVALVLTAGVLFASFSRRGRRG